MYNLSIKFACLILAATLTLAGCGSSSSSDDPPTPTPPPVTNPPVDDDDDNGGDDNGNGNGNGDDEPEVPDEPAEPVIISFDFADGIEGWYLNGEGPGITSSENIEISHDASASAMVITPFNWDTDNWKLEPRAQIEPTDLSGATITFVLDVPQVYADDGDLAVQISADNSYFGWSGVVAGENTITGTVPDSVGTTGNFGLQLSQAPSDKNIAEPILVKLVTVELAVQDDNAEVVPPAELDFDNLHALADFPIGVSVDGPAGMPSQEERSVVEQHFNQITAGNIMKMSYLHNEWEKYTHDNAEALVEYAADNNMTMHGHALVWHSCYQVPAWAREFDGTEEQFLDQVREHARSVASYYDTKYPGTIVSWDVVNEAFKDDGNYRDAVADCDDNGEGSVFGYHARGPEFIKASFEGAHAGAPNAELYYNDFSLVPNHEKLNGGNGAPGVLGMLDGFDERGVPIDGVGFQMHIYIDWPSINDIRQSFKKVADRNLKVKVTELDVAAYNPYGGQSFVPYTQELADQQKQRYCEIMEAYMDDTIVPPHLRGGFTVWGVSDADTWLTGIPNFNGNPWPLLFDVNLEPKPAIMGVANALRGRSCSE